jgi:hypothetical protein
MDEKTDALKARFDAFSRLLDARMHAFKTTGRLASEGKATESLRKRQEAMKIKLDRAIRAGAVSDILKLEFDRNLDALLGEFSRLEKEFDAAAATDAKSAS